MAKMYFTDPIVTQFGKSVCMKIVNDQGEELSLSGDNSCGGMPNLGRMSIAMFDKEDDFMMPEVYAPSVKDFLELLAEHLGYDVRPKYNEEAIKAEIRKGEKMNAIRLMRQMCTLTLRDAKYQVEEIMDEMREKGELGVHHGK